MTTFELSDCNDKVFLQSVLTMSSRVILYSTTTDREWVGVVQYE
jgi:hypothetical protein